MSLAEVSNNGHGKVAAAEGKGRLAARQERQRAAVEMLREGASRDEVAERFGVSARWVGLRVTEARADGTAAPAPTDGTAAAKLVDGTAAPKLVEPSRPRQPRATPKRVGISTQPPLALRLVSIGAVSMVAVVTAVASYTHIRYLAEIHGMADLAVWLPLGIDGLIVACTCSVIANSGRGVLANLPAWTGLVFGLVASVTANVMAVGPDPVAQALAGYSPLALALAGHLLFKILGGPDARSAR
jgi:transposase-like protein